MRTIIPLVLFVALVGFFDRSIAAASPDDGSVLPFPSTPSASVAKPRLQDSIHKRRTEPIRVAADAPNILIILVDDAGFGVPDTFGGFAHTPTLTRLRKEGLCYNRFHTTSICSPTRAALLTGRNHQRVGSGTIAERAVDWDGYTGIIPKSSATIAETLHHYGYKTSAFGKWHNTPADQTTSMGPFDYWPTGYGFDYFYGFLAGETSQWEPRLIENTTAIEPPHNENYHLTEDMVDKSVTWLKHHRAFAPDKPFFMYWAPGGVHGPHHVAKQWADKYQGKFNQGWDKLREEIFARQKQLGWIPEDTQLTPRHKTMPAWDSIPASERSFQTRLMEIYAGFCEHTDAQVGRLIDSLEEMNLRENTLIFYIWGDNGSSAEGQNGSISELLAQNQIPNTITQQIGALKELGGLDALGTSVTDNMYHAGWAWAGSTPFHNTKLVASHFGGTRNPLVVSWPKNIKADQQPRTQFYHVNDVAPTIYEVLKIKHPKSVNGFEQDPIDGVSMAKSLTAADAPENKPTQYFDNNGSRGIYHQGWFACTFGPLIPWLNAQKGLAEWDSANDVWELYDLRQDFSQARDLAAQHPEKLAELKQLFLAEAQRNNVFPIGAGIWLRLHPEDRIKTSHTRWTFDDTTTRMPEFTAPPVGNHSNAVTLNLEFGERSSGVLYALGGSGGGLACYMDDGHLCFEYNLMIIDRTVLKSRDRLLPGKHTIVVKTLLKEEKPGSPADIILTVDGDDVARGTAAMTVPAAFTASESFDVGMDLGSPVARDYFKRSPFKFNGTIEKVTIELK
ncbi:arylsulfatase [Schlesneria paludicola]|uniref:arylsulfatase n=1 Tax=Schlesneria paludicola TaxID=360056 RepID=UPI00029B4FF8|nr:arylsulfatase [Schlesneria paludicola]